MSILEASRNSNDGIREMSVLLLRELLVYQAEQFRYSEVLKVVIPNLLSACADSSKEVGRGGGRGGGERRERGWRKVELI